MAASDSLIGDGLNPSPYREAVKRAEKAEQALRELALNALAVDLNRQELISVLIAEREELLALLREAQERSVYLIAPATDDHRITLRERIAAVLAKRR